jgi:plasmid stabilization system protein ParE
VKRFVLSDAARADVVIYAAYLRAQGAPEAAKRFRDGLDQAATRLIEMPELGSPWETGHLELLGLR